jgi:hypothetical protein
VNSQQDDSSEVKTHDEIMRLFKDLELAEARVKNPEELKKDIIASETPLQEIEPSLRLPEEAVEQEHYIEPASEIPQDKKEKQRHPFWKRKNDYEPDYESPDATTEDREQFERIPRSTFVLQLDSNGTLVGLPVKKPKPEGEKKQEEEPETGIRGRLHKIGSLFRQKDSSEAEPSEGIGAKIKGIFRRE